MITPGIHITPEPEVETGKLQLPLVSVVIPCYNQARYLANAVESIHRQTYPNIEIIVVNDGSTDNTEEVAKSLSGVIYFHQSNQGLPGARNRGWRESKGTFIAFLDADDWLYPDAIEINLKALIDQPGFAFSSGGFTEVHDHEKKQHHIDLVDAPSQVARAEATHYSAQMYRFLLEGNCIGNPAAVLYTRWVLESIEFDSNDEIKGCEDYDHYLKITRRYPVFHHHAKISFYRKHAANMSNDSVMMLESALAALERQKRLLENEEEMSAYLAGVKNWKRFYLNRYVSTFRNGIIRSILSFGTIHDPELNPIFINKYKREILGLLQKKAFNKIRNKIKKITR